VGVDQAAWRRQAGGVDRRADPAGGGRAVAGVDDDAAAVGRDHGDAGLDVVRVGMVGIPPHPTREMSQHDDQRTASSRALT
jgi:hypothetical protein